MGPQQEEIGHNETGDAAQETRTIKIKQEVARTPRPRQTGL